MLDELRYQLPSSISGSADENASSTDVYDKSDLIRAADKYIAAQMLAADLLRRCPVAAEGIRL